MEVRADITREDYEAFRRHAERKASVGTKRPRFALLVVVWAVAAVIFTWLYTTTTWAPRYILSAGVGVALGIALSYWGARLQQTDLSPEEGGFLLGPRTITAVDGGLRLHSETTELWVSAAAIRAVEQTADHVFVFIDRGAAIIVPKRAFASEDELALFLGEIA